jgi:hypothetical protein
MGFLDSPKIENNVPYKMNTIHRISKAGGRCKRGAGKGLYTTRYNNKNQK